METGEFLNLAGRKKKTVLFVVIIFLCLAALITFVQPLKYEARSRLLVIQNFSAGTDPYTMSKSNEYLSNLLANVTASDSFFNDVMGSGFNMDKGYFPEQANKKMKEWKKTVSARAVNDTAIIAISVYHPDKYQLEQIARAVNYVLMTKNNQYHGAGNSVSIKIIDEPILSEFPAKPDIPVNFALALVLGFIFGLGYIYLFPEAKYDLVWPFPGKKAGAGTRPVPPELWRSGNDDDSGDLRSAAEAIKRSQNAQYEKAPAVVYSEADDVEAYAEDMEKDLEEEEYRIEGDIKNVVQ